MKKKRGFCLLLFFVLAVCALTGCGKNHGLSSDNPVTLIIWHYYNGDQMVAFDNMILAFNETVGRKKGIIVEAYSQGSVDQLIDAVKASADKKVGAAELPDIFTGYTDLVYEIDQKGKIASLDEYFTKDELNEYISAYLDEGRYAADGKLRVFPTAKSTELLMLNKTDWLPFAEATGATYDDLKTWEGIARTAQAYYEWTDAATPEADDGKPFFGRDSDANYIIVGCKQLGQEICAVKDGKAQLTMDEGIMRRLWDNFYVPYVNGYYTSIGRFRSDDAKTGDLIAWIGSSTSASYFPSEVIRSDTEAYSIEAEILQLPGFDGTEPYAVQQGAGMAVTKSNETKEYACTEFLRWFTDEEQNMDFAVDSSYLPVKRNVNDTVKLQEYVAERKDAIRPVVAKSLETAMKQVNEYNLFTSMAFDGGNDVRNILAFALVDKAKEDRELIACERKNGRRREEAVSLYTTDQNFKNWYDTLKMELENRMN